MPTYYGRGFVADDGTILAAPAADGTNGQVIQTDGSGSLSFVDGGSGDVTKVGTPANNQIGVWTGDGTIEGDSDLVFDGTNLGVGAASPGAIVEINAATASNKGLIVQSTDDSTTNNSVEVQNAAGTALAYITADGTVYSKNLKHASTNTFVSPGSGDDLTSGTNNTSLGYLALQDVTTGANNVGVGSQACEKVTTGNNNFGLGFRALSKCTTGSTNTAVGAAALENSTTSTGMVAVGYGALNDQVSSFNNTAVGSYSSEKQTSAQKTTAVGAYTLFANLTGINQTAVGYGALIAATGASNTAIGAEAGDEITTGTQNIAIGYNAQVASATASNQLSIGNTIYGDLSTAKIGIGVTAPTATLHVAASTTAKASLNIPSGTAPTSPNNGDIWSDGSDILVRLGGTTYTLTKS